MHKKLISLCLALLLLCSAAVLPTAAEEARVEVYLTFGDGLADAAAAAGGAAPFLASDAGRAAYAALTAELDAAARELLGLVPALTVLGQNWYLSAGLAVSLPADDLTALGRFAAARGNVMDLAEIGTRTLAAAEDAAAGAGLPEYAPAMVGADALHADGIRGAGTLVAVIDAGFDADHPVFADHDGVAVTLTREGLRDLLPTLNLADSMPASSEGTVLYLNDKIPLAYDYADCDFDVSAADSHGTHVASIVGGGEDADGRVVGIAPDAQLMLLKIFPDGGADTVSEYAIYCAVEDAVVLGADVINLSLGASPGHPYRTSSFSIDRFIKRARALGCAVVCAVGNEGRVGEGSVYAAAGIDLPLAVNPDYGMTADPASFPGAVAVGAYVPAYSWLPSLSAGDFSFAYADSSDGQGFADMSFIRRFDRTTLPLVVVPGLGEPDDYAGLDAAGKLVLVERGTIPFTEKLQAAAAAGAVGMICYDNVEGELFSMAFEAMPIPAVSISRADGLRLIAMPDETRQVQVEQAKRVGLAGANAPADYSSQGSGLLMRPTVSAPGTVYAALPDGGYGAKSGSSMAAPAVSGLLALAVDVAEAEITAAAMDELLADLITAAVPFADGDGTPYSVRKQGGGAIGADFLSTDTALRASGQGLAELGDGLGSRFSLTLSLTNRANTTKTYTLAATLGSDAYRLHNDGGREIVFADDGIRLFADAAVEWQGRPINRAAGQSASLTLAAGETAELTLTFALSAAEAEDYAARFPRGFYLEGFVFVTDEAGTQLSLPYLGFSGDFDALPALDTFDYDDGQSFFGGQRLYSTDGILLSQLGRLETDGNPRYLADLIAFSPNGDGVLDTVDVKLRLLRNLHSLDAYVTDDAGETVWSQKRSFYLTKSFVNSAGQLETADGAVWGGTDQGTLGYVLPDGSYTLHLDVLAPDGSVAETVELPVVLDTAAPTLTSHSISETNGRRYLTLYIADGHYPRTATLYRTETDRYGRTTDLYRDEHYISYAAGRRTIGLRYDITDFAGDYLYLDVDDYAGNAKTYKIKLD